MKGGGEIIAAGKNETLFHELDLFLSYRVLEAFVRDSLFRRHDDPERVLTRCFRKDELRFSDIRLHEVFAEAYRDLWDEVRASYNLFTDQIRGPLRERALQIVERHLAFLHRLQDADVRPEQLPERMIRESARAMTHVEEFLELLNFEEPLTGTQAQELDEVLDGLEQHLGGTYRSAEASIDRTRPVDFRAEGRINGAE